jgi:TPR repeat protein
MAGYARLAAARAKVARLLRQAANQGHADAQFNLGNCYDEG